MATNNAFKVKNGLEAPSTETIVTTIDAGPSIRPSLLLDFAKTKTLDPRITFTRGSTGTYYDGKTSVMAEQNLLIYSQDFTNGWTKVSATVTANSTMAPDGTTTASTITSSGTSYSAVKQTISSAPGTTYTASVYILKTSGAITYYPCFVFRRNSSGTQICGVYIDTTSGILTLNTDAAASAPISYGIVSAGNYWRVYITGTSTDTVPAVDFYPALSTNGSTSSSGLVGSQVIWGAQLEQRSQVTAYTPTTTAAITNYIPVMKTAAAGVPRFDHNPTTGESLGLLIEESRTNLLTYSSDFDVPSSIWGKTNCSIAARCMIAPDGTQTASKLIETTTSSVTHYTSQAFTATAQTYTFSVYLKSGGRTFGDIAFDGGGLSAFFDLTNGVVGTVSGVTAQISSVGNGWYKCSITTTLSAGGHSVIIWIGQTNGNNSYTGDGYSGIYIWGAQLEAGAFPTSYIPTTSSTVTRSADSASMTGVNFSSWYRTDQGTLYSEYARLSSGTLNTPVVCLAADTSNYVNYYGSAGYDFLYASSMGSAGVLNATFGSTSTAYKKFAVALQVDNVSATYNGNAVTSDTSYPQPSPFNTLYIGSNYNSSSMNGTIKRIAYYPKRLTNTELLNITTN